MLLGLLGSHCLELYLVPSTLKFLCSYFLNNSLFFSDKLLEEQDLTRHKDEFVAQLKRKFIFLVSLFLLSEAF